LSPEILLEILAGQFSRANFLVHICISKLLVGVIVDVVGEVVGNAVGAVVGMSG
jgi:hypothetical protein